MTSRPSKKTTQGVRAGLGVLRVHEIAGQAFALERHLDDLDLHVGQRDELVEAIDRGAIGVERLRSFGVRKRSPIW